VQIAFKLLFPDQLLNMKGWIAFGGEQQPMISAETLRGALNG
jgi:hypothetical protein